MTEVFVEFNKSSGSDDEFFLYSTYRPAPSANRACASPLPLLPAPPSTRTRLKAMTASMSRTLSPPPSERTALLLAESVSPPSKDEDHLSDPTKLSKRARNCVLGAMWIGVFLGALDTTIVATLVSDVSSSFEKSNQASWLGTSYLLSTATFTPL